MVSGLRMMVCSGQMVIGGLVVCCHNFSNALPLRGPLDLG